MEQMIALWSMVMIHGLMVPGLGIEPNLSDRGGPETENPREAYGSIYRMWYTYRPVSWPVPQLKRLKRKFIL